MIPFSIPPKEEGMGLFEVFEQVDFIKSMRIRHRDPTKVHVSSITYCPASGAARVIKEMRDLLSGDVVFNRIKHSKLNIGSWIHEGLQSWFIRLFYWAMTTPLEEIRFFRFPPSIYKLLLQIRQEGGYFKREIYVSDPEPGLVGHSDLIRFPTGSGNPGVYEIKTGAGQKKQDKGHYRQVNLYRQCLFPNHAAKDVEMGIIQVRFWGGYIHDYWFEPVHPIEVDYEERIRLYWVAFKAIEAGEVPPEECYDPPEKKGFFTYNSWQCQEKYCFCVDCPYRKVPKVKKK